MDRTDGATILVSLVAIALLAVVAGSLPFPEAPEPADETDPNGSQDDEEPPEPAPAVPTIAPFAFLALLALVGVVTAFVGYRRLVRSPAGGRAGKEESRDDGPPETDDRLEAVADVAGTAADRIHRTDAYENEIYRAWAEMTRALSLPNPETKTPGEFADAAVRAGMEESDVAELTRLFSAVRYGNREFDAADERRAVEILERIEAAYAGDRS